jgi:hypothetical protein
MLNTLMKSVLTNAPKVSILLLTAYKAMMERVGRGDPQGERATDCKPPWAQSG